MKKYPTLYSSYNPFKTQDQERITGEFFKNAAFYCKNFLGYGEMEIIGDTSDQKNKHVILSSPPDSNFSTTQSKKFNAQNVLTGKFCLFIGFFQNHYGHFLHDNLPIFEMLRRKLSKDTKFLIPYEHKTAQKILSLVDPEWTSRIQLFDSRHPVSVSGETYFVNLAQTKLPSKFHHLSDYREDLRRALQKHEKIQNQECIVFCPRLGDNKNGRTNEPQQQKQILSMIRKTCSSKNFNAKISIFKHEDHKTPEQQKKFFENASIIIGVHGTALTNMIWSNRMSSFNSKPLQVIEGVGLTEAYLNHPGVQQWNDLGYYRLFAEGFNVDWRHFFYHPSNLNFKNTYINISNIQRALEDSINILS